MHRAVVFRLCSGCGVQGSGVQGSGVQGCGGLESESLIIFQSSFS